MNKPKIILYVFKSIGLFIIIITFNHFNLYTYEWNEFNANIILDTLRFFEHKYHPLFANDSFSQYDSAGIKISKSYDKDDNIQFVFYYKIEKSQNNTDSDKTFTPRTTEFKYYPSGKIKSIIYYNDNFNIEGELKSFFEDGSIRRDEIYKDGNLKNGKCYSKDRKIIEHFPFEVEPNFDIEELSKNIIYPENLRRLNIEEKVMVRILIDTSGIPVKMLYDAHQSKEFINEIARIFKNKLVKFSPLMVEGDAFDCWITIPVLFQLKK